MKAWNITEQNESLVESAWEREMQLLGSRTYEARREDTAASDTQAGRRALKKYVNTLATALEKFQRSVVNKPRTERTLKGAIIVVPAETLALLSLRVLIDRTYGIAEPETGVSYSTVSKAIGKAVEIELNFRHWIASSREAASDYAKENGLEKTPVSLAERLITQEGVSRASLFRWRASFEELTKYKWDDLEKYYAGDGLLGATCEALPDCFEVHTPWRRGHPQKNVRMTEKFITFFEAVETCVSRSQATKKPMLTRPRPWARTEE